MNKSCVYTPWCCVRQWDCLFGKWDFPLQGYLILILFWLFPFPLLVQGKKPSKREGGDHELFNGNAQLCRCASPKVQHLKSCWFSKALYLLKRSP